MANFAKVKSAIDKRSGVTNWTFHDLRRSARTRMSQIGVNADVAERCLGHLATGVRAVYDRHDFLAEKRNALERWAAELDRIVDPPKGNVVALTPRS